jgi:hypothetical protein
MPVLGTLIRNCMYAFRNCMNYRCRQSAGKCSPSTPQLDAMNFSK